MLVLGTGQNCRDDFFLFHLGEKTMDEGMLHRVMHVMHIEQATGIGDDSVTTVEDADLHVFEGRHIGDELGADFLEFRAARAGIVLHHPLLELFTEHRPIVLNAKVSKAIWRSRSEVAGVMRSTMALGNATLASTHSASRVHQAGQTGDSISRDNTIVRNVITRHHGIGRKTLRLAGLEAMQDQTEHACRCHRGFSRHVAMPDVGDQTFLSPG